MYLQAITLHILPSPTIAFAYLHSAHWWWCVSSCWPSSPGRCWEMFKCQDNTMNNSMLSAQLEYITNLIPNSLHFFLLGSCSCMFILFILLPFASCYTFLISVAFGNYDLEQPSSGMWHWLYPENKHLAAATISLSLECGNRRQQLTVCSILLSSSISCVQWRHLKGI